MLCFKILDAAGGVVASGAGVVVGWVIAGVGNGEWAILPTCALPVCRLPDPLPSRRSPFAAQENGHAAPTFG